jgi:predicted membrane-bound spermidine synthase
MYHVTSTASTAILLYLISYFFYRIGFFSLQVHRKFWNVILLMAFLLTAIAGVFIALQINYKWDIPVIKTITKWHVEFGIGMAITGLFHLIWHLNYYFRIVETSAGNSAKQKYPKSESNEIKINLFITGFVSASVQFLLMREILNIAGGHELTTGSYLGSWLITSALGASIASKSTLNNLRRINLVFALSPLISLFLMIFLTRLYLNPGETPSFLVSVIYTFIILLPFCLVSAFTFVKLIKIAGSENNIVPGKSFSVETSGGIVSGILISIITAGLLNTYKLLLLIILLSSAYVVITFYIRENRSKIIARLIISVLATGIVILNPDIFFRQLLLPGTHVADSKDSPYGNITRASYRGEESLYYNQRLAAYKDDVIEREEDIHYAMLQSESTDRVILISGSLQSHLPEILKYPVSSVTYIERDPALSGYQTNISDSLHRKVNIVHKDAYGFIRNSSDFADIIILLVPPPSTLLLNRYFTNDFFSAVKKRLKPNGIFLCSPGPGDNYLNKEALNMYSSIFNGLSASFKNVKPVIGNKFYFIASDKSLSLSFCQLSDKRQVKNTYVSSDYLDDELINKKSEEALLLLDHKIRQNSLAFPVAIFHSQSYFFSKSIDEKIPTIIVMIILFVLPAAAVKRRNLLMYFTASALAGFEIIILLILQIIEGNMYQLTGLIIAALMAGLALGSGINNGPQNTISIKIKVISLILFYVIFGFLYNNMTELKSGFTATGLIMVSGFLPALLTGSIFRELTLNEEGLLNAPAIYSADLAGSALGFIIISGLSIPLFGIQVSVFLLSVLILAGILLGTSGNK